MTIDEALRQPTISVPDAGRLFFGLSENGAYDAAKRKDIPTIRIGRKLLVPTAAVAKMLGLESLVGQGAST